MCFLGICSTFVAHEVHLITNGVRKRENKMQIYFVEILKLRWRFLY
jgi:hypothetical protein